VCGLKEDQAEQSQGSETDHSRSGRLKKSPSVEVEAEPREKTEKKERSQLLQSRLIQWIGEECKKVTWADQKKISNWLGSPEKYG
jgi:hypothetical protein